MRITGALAYDLACIAIGELGARVSLDAKTVDVAAGAFLITQAGGKITDLDGEEWTTDSSTVLAARTSALHRTLLSIF